MLKNVLRFSLIAWFGAMACLDKTQAAPQSVALPVLGYVFDGGNGLRPMIGVPGAASIGNALDLGFAISGATVPAGHDYILVTTHESSWPRVVQLRGGTISVQALDSIVIEQQQQQVQPDECESPIDDVSRRPRPSCRTYAATAAAKIDRIALSPDGSAAALFSGSQHRIYAFINLSGAPQLLGSFDIGRVTAPSALGISDDGKTIAVGISNRTPGSLLVMNLDGSRFVTASMRHPSAIAFTRGGDSVIVADDVENKIYSIGAGQPITLAGAENGISGPTAVAVSNDGQRVFVANSLSGSITTIRMSGTVDEPLKCDCVLSGLQPTNTDSVFRLTDFSGGPVLLLDASNATPRLVFVRNGSSQF